jgi:membrane complex biogenesis BtpA family protein
MEEAKIFISEGAEALLIENMHDSPYLNRKVGPEITSLMSIILYKIKSAYDVSTGIQILAGANKEALAAAKAANADFIRAEGFVFSHIADEGLMNADAGELLRYRAQIDAGSVEVFTDIKKKHSSHMITADIDIVDTAKATEFFLSDGVIVTGGATGKEPSAVEMQRVKENINIPVLAGSGITADNIHHYWDYCDGFIVGSYLKEDGKWNNPVAVNRVQKLIEAHAKCG